MKKYSRLAVTFAALMVAGCKNHGAAAPATTGSAAMTGSAATTGSGQIGSAPVAGSAATSGSAATPDVPTPADFEARAATEITDKNLESSLGEIEKDLGK